MSLEMMKRRYARVPMQYAADMVHKNWQSQCDGVDGTNVIPITRVDLYQVGSGGCGVLCESQGFCQGECVYLNIPGERGEVPLSICAQIVWKSVEGAACRYGLEFMWIRKEAGEESFDKVKEMLNRVLGPTGRSLMNGG